MIRRAGITIIFFFTLSSLFSQRARLFYTTAGVINFKSDAPFELIKASSKDLIGLLDVDKKTFAFKVKVQTFQGFNSALQREHFNENYLESAQYPDASFGGKIIEDIDLAKDGNYAVRAKGNLVVHGISQERIIKVDMVVSQGNINAKSAFTVLLSDHNIPIPKVVKDKLASEIKVDVSAQLAPR
jgi:hypothetical protein